MVNEDNVVNVSLTSELVTDFLSYTTAVYGRALPDIVDGLKVAQRRVLLSLLDLSLDPESPYCKVTRVEGHALGNYHPNGSCSGTIINLGQESAQRYTLTQIHGNVGGSIQTGHAIGQMVSDDAPAAARYLEVRSTVLCKQLYLSQVRKGIGSWRPNYDGTRSEPVRIVPTLPALLLTGSSGIASGYACDHVPWNLTDVISATVAWIKDKNITDKKLAAKFSHPPEPALGGRVVKDEGVKSALMTGRGQITVYGDWEVQDKLPWGKRSTRPALIITRLAHGSSERFLDRVRSLADAERLPGLLDAADHSSRDGIRIVLVTKSVEDRDLLISVLVHNGTGLKHTYSVNATAVGMDGKPKTVGVREIISTWYGERVKYLCDVNGREVDRLREESEKLSATVKVLTSLDRFLKTIRTAKDKSDAVAKVAKGWKISTELARYVIGIPVSILISTEIEEVKDKHGRVLEEISNLAALSEPGPLLDDFISKEVEKTKLLLTKARSVWKGEPEEVKERTPASKKPTLRETILAEGKEIGLSTRAVNKWLRENTGTGKVLERWKELKAAILEKGSSKSQRAKPRPRKSVPTPSRSGKSRGGKKAGS